MLRDKKRFCKAERRQEQSLFLCSTWMHLFPKAFLLRKEAFFFLVKQLLSKIDRRVFRDFLYTSCPSAYLSLPLSTSPPEWYSCYDWYNLHWHIIIIQIPKFTIGFTLGVVHSIGLNKHIMKYIQCMVS